MKETVKVLAKTGIYANVASLLVETAGRFESEVKLVYRGKYVNAKSILGVMSLGIQSGAIFELEVEGIDKLACLSCIEKELANNISKIEA
ncbi:MAG TPA: phosphocarrier protein HPr [Firmicutes bacterium]|nr:phosphocarrier protein HPr [Bacillota bacterium]